MISKHDMEMWSKCLDIIKDNIEPEQFNAWFVPIVALEYKDNCLTLQLPSTYYVEHINAHYLNLLGGTLQRVFGPKVRLFYKYNVVGGEPSSSVTVENEKVSSAVGSKVERVRGKVPIRLPSVSCPTSTRSSTRSTPSRTIAAA